MKKPIIALIIAASVLAVFAVLLPTVYGSNAAEVEVSAPGANGAENKETPTVSDIDKNEKKSFYTSLTEAVRQASDPSSLSRTVTWICSLVSVIIITLIRGSLMKIRNRISGTLDSTTSKTNELVECYNQNNEKIDRLEKDVSLIGNTVGQKSERDERTYQAVLSFAEMLFMVYNNSTTIPDGMKDVLRSKYAKICGEAGKSAYEASDTEEK